LTRDREKQYNLLLKANIKKAIGSQTQVRRIGLLWPDEIHRRGEEGFAIFGACMLQ
jgi:hypothetical protein